MGEHGQARRGRRMIRKSERGWHRKPLRKRETENFPTQYLTVKAVTNV